MNDLRLLQKNPGTGEPVPGAERLFYISFSEDQAQ